MVTRLQSVHVWCVARILVQESFYLLWVHADTFHWLIKIPHKNKQTEGYALFQTWDVRHKTTMFCHLQTRIINSTRLDSILTAYLNILAVLESFKSLYTLYKTKTQVANNKHSFSHPIAGIHSNMFEHVATNKHIPSFKCVHACTHTQHWCTEMLHNQ